MKKIDLNTATLEELKAVAYDNLRQIENMQRQQQILNGAIEKKEKEHVPVAIPTKEEV